jgi:AcrR family transcriptional regulator
VSIDEVAEQANVGRTTVFEQFGSKLKLLEAVEQDVSARAGVDKLLQALLVPDARASLRAAFQVGCHVWAREAEMFRKLFGLAIVDPEMRKVMAEKQQKRVALIDHLATQLEQQGCLKSGKTKRDAIETLSLLTSFEAFDALYALSGDSQRVADQLEEMVSVLLVPAARSAVNQ